jgi:hypothetical protein
MNKRLINEMIEDCEKVIKIMTNRIEMLKQMRGDEKRINVKEEIAKRKKEMTSEINKVRSEIMSKIGTASMPNIGTNPFISHMNRSNKYEKDE